MKLIYRIKPPCPKCLYRLGLVQSLVNPCHSCKRNGYRDYERFKEQFARKIDEIAAGGGDAV
jgi:hypothetical protein